jgi:hypothetical protein
VDKATQIPTFKTQKASILLAADKISGRQQQINTSVLAI